MILVTVGMHDEPFDRLVRVADEMASLVGEPVVIQCGVSRYTPMSSRHFDFTDEAGMQELLSKARVVVSHSGAGSILSVLQAGKPLVLVSRLKCFGEVFDDHQVELAEALASAGKVIFLTDVTAEGLKHAIDETSQILGELTLASSPLVKVLREYFASFLQQ